MPGKATTELRLAVNTSNIGNNIIIIPTEERINYQIIDPQNEHPKNG